MEKFHLYYLQGNLFKAAPGIAKPPTENQEMAATTKLHFARIIPSCELNKARQAALGIDIKGRPKHNNKKSNADKHETGTSSSEDSIEGSTSNNKKKKTKK